MFSSPCSGNYVKLSIDGWYEYKNFTVFVPLFGELCKTRLFLYVFDVDAQVFVPLFGELCKTRLSWKKKKSKKQFSSPCSGNYVKRDGDSAGRHTGSKGFRPLVRGTM